MTESPDQPAPQDTAPQGWLEPGNDPDVTSSGAWDDGLRDALEPPSSSPVDEAGDLPEVDDPSFDPLDADVPLVAVGIPEPGDGGQGDDDLEVWFAGDWVDPSVVPGGPGADLYDDLPGDAEIGTAARLLWYRAYPDTLPPADDVVSMLRAVAEAGQDELDQRAARVLLGLLEAPST